MMKNPFRYFLPVSLILMHLIVFAQSDGSKTSVFKPSELSRKPIGFLNQLLNPSKFSMSHSYSISYFSFGRQGFSQGLYLNTMNYRFSDPLQAQVQIGYVHQPFGGMRVMGNDSGRLFVQRATIQYKPSDKFLLTIDYQSYPYSMAYPNDMSW